MHCNHRWQCSRYNISTSAEGNIHMDIINTLRPRQNGLHFPDDIFDYIFLNENVRISRAISLKFVPRGPIWYIPALVQIMAWRRPGDKPLSEPMMIILQTYICVTRPQWVKTPKTDVWSARGRLNMKMLSYMESYHTDKTISRPPHPLLWWEYHTWKYGCYTIPENTVAILKRGLRSDWFRRDANRYHLSPILIRPK